MSKRHQWKFTWSGRIGVVILPHGLRQPCGQWIIELVSDLENGRPRHDVTWLQ
ncbi:MAG: hypothetical protein MUE63_00105 [Xanthomonadales bacterium]|jgi:hypothetical protein|nr:hypothetical protein [Xanthomonadales bacterium]